MKTGNNASPQKHRTTSTQIRGNIEKLYMCIDTAGIRIQKLGDGDTMKSGANHSTTEILKETTNNHHW